MSAVKDENYINVQGWMVTQLGLKGNELLIYAIIYGFSQAEGQSFNGGLRYLADWLNATKRTVMDNLKGLVEKDLIEKSENFINGVKFCEYRCKDFAGVVKKLPRGGEDSSMGGGEKTSPNNKSLDNKEDNKKKERKKATTYEEIIDQYIPVALGEVQSAVYEFIKMRQLIKKPLTDKALELLLKKLLELGHGNPVEMVEILNQSIMNNWQGIFPLKDEPQKQRPKKKEVYYEPELYGGDFD